jgi:hypothetical protein
VRLARAVDVDKVKIALFSARNQAGQFGVAQALVADKFSLVACFAHLLVDYPPKVAVSNMVNSLKGVSSRLLRKERPDIVQHYYKGVLWSPSYFAASCGGAPIEIIRQYIEQQQTPD